MKYKVILEVIYPTEVEAESEEEAIELAMAKCPYDNADEVKPVVEKIQEKWIDNYEDYQNASNDITFSQYPMYRGK